ncbi:TonB-dependent receptor [Paremcibacter congregatus]|uniref:TonB-dependent receptor n=1 Tax=Paremcibacter congregatus TaxID=2043170 RepID=A0A2G4YUC7_9PROT|nr:TonB-dependent receptor [Paremcibacter congregatus]PHZ85942.1 TonB-dependent receptor [Paremcibacter congregatus]QDE26907.1 TonB-dependent receptor [Paremcibacter congregatus]
MNFKMHLLGCAALSVLTGGLSAQAQDTAEAGDVAIFEEIVVTARKTAESLQDTPIALSAFTESAIETRGINELGNIGKIIPNLFFGGIGAGSANVATVAIRGIGQVDHLITTDPAVGIYIDGVYLGRTIGANLDIINVERIEVARGPQGTLFGRNTLGGAVNVITKKPTGEDTVRVDVKAGTRDRADAAFYADMGISDTLSMSLSGGIVTRGGVGEALLENAPKSEIGEEFSVNGRLAMNWQPTDSANFLLTVDRSADRGGASPRIALFGGVPLAGGPVNPDNDSHSTDGLEQTTNDSFGVALTSTWEVSDSMTVKSITSYRKQDYVAGGDDDGVAAEYFSFPETGNSKQFSQELQIQGSEDWGNWVTGLFYFYEDGGIEQNETYFAGYQGFQFLDQTTNSYAAFAHVDYHVTDRLSLGGGLRYSEDKKDASSFLNTVAERQDRNEKWDALTWNVSANYKASDDISLYGSINRGYQSGGYPPRPFSGAEAFKAYDPTYAMNYEIGAKGTFFERLQVNATAFYTKYTDFVVASSFGVPGGFVSILENAAEANSKGFEVEATWAVSDNFRIQSAIGHLDTEVTSVKANVTGASVGNQLNNAPDWTVSIAPDYTHKLDNGGSIIAHVEYSYRGNVFAEVNNHPQLLNQSRSLVDFMLTYESPTNDWRLSIYGENIFNKVYDNGRLFVPLGFPGLDGTFFADQTLIFRSTDRSEFGVKFTKEF